MESQSGEDGGDVVDVGVEGASSDGGEIGDLGVSVSTMLTRLELSLACFSEKVANLEIFVMNLETLEGELEALVSEQNAGDGIEIDVECVEKGLEFDLLCGVLDSEVNELGVFLGNLHSGIADVGERVSSSEDDAWKDKLEDYENGLKQSEEQLSGIKKQSASFQRTLSSYKREGSGKVEDGEIITEDEQSSDDNNTAIKMQTNEQQRHILRMLEKSLAREMELEKSFNDSREIEETLKMRMVSLEQELVLVEEEATDVWERWFEADNARGILMGISKDLLGRLQISQFNLNGLSQRESELRAKIEKQVKEYECQLLNAKASANEYKKQYEVICSEMKNMENLIVELKENISNAESRANAAESECKLLTETNSELNKEMALLKDGGGTCENVESLERQLKETDLRLQHAVASAEASQEKQSMLYSAIKDMEQVMKDLKSKVSKAESRADSAEDKCVILSESNAELNEELSFLRSRLECLEGSMHLAEETKVETAKDIGKRMKVFKILITQIAVERERLYKQVSYLASENRMLVLKLKQTNKAATDHKVDRSWWKNSFANDNEVKFGDSLPDAGTVRRIDAGALNFKLLFISLLVLLVSAMAFVYFKDVNFDVFL